MGKRRQARGGRRSRAEGRSASPPEDGIPAVSPHADNQERTTSSITWGVKRPRSFRSRGRRILSNFNETTAPSDRPNPRRDGVLTTDAEVRMGQHAQHSRAVLTVAPPHEARSTTRNDVTAENKRLIDEVEHLRQKLHAEDSSYKKELKTLKRKLYGVVNLCESHGLEVPSRMLMASQVKKKRLMENVTISAPSIEVLQNQVPESDAGDEEELEGLSDGLLLLHQAARPLMHERPAVGYDWAAEMEAAEEEFSAPRHDATSMVPEEPFPREPADAPHAREGLTPVHEDEDDLFIYPAPGPTQEAIPDPPDAPVPTPEALPPPPTMMSEATQTEQTTGGTKTTQTGAQTMQTTAPVAMAAETQTPVAAENPHRTHVDEIRDDLLGVKPVSITGASRTWLKRQRRNLRTLLTSMYGEAWLNGARGKEEAVQRATQIQPSIEGFNRANKRLPSSEEVTQVLASVIHSIPGLWRALKSTAAISAGRVVAEHNEDEECACCAKAVENAEIDTVAAIKEHMDEIAVPLYSLLNLTERRYQDLITYWSNVWDEQGERKPFFLPSGTKIPSWMSKNKLLRAQKEFLEGLGLTMCAEKKLPTSVLRRSLFDVSSTCTSAGSSTSRMGKHKWFRSLGMLQAYSSP